MTTKRYTIQEAAHELGIDRATLTRRLKRLKIQPLTIAGDGRYRYVSAAHLQQIRDAYPADATRTISASHQPDTRQSSATDSDVATLTDADLRSLIKELQMRVDTLALSLRQRSPFPEAVKRDSEGLPLGVDRLPIQIGETRVYRDRSASNTIPDGYCSVGRFATLYSVPQTTLMRAIERGHYAHQRGEWIEHGHKVTLILSPATQATILRDRGRDVPDAIAQYLDSNETE